MLRNSKNAVNIELNDGFESKHNDSNPILFLEVKIKIYDIQIKAVLSSYTTYFQRIFNQRLSRLQVVTDVVVAAFQPPMLVLLLQCYVTATLHST